MKTKILKIKIGNVYINNQNHPVFADAWQKKSEDGIIYYEIKTPIFVQEVAIKTKEKIQEEITA